MLEHPRWLMERHVDFSGCHHGGHFNEFLPECQNCQFGPGCRWLNTHRSHSLADAPLKELVDALRSAVDYVEQKAGQRHDRHCDCEDCTWLHAARRLLRTFSSRNRQR